MTKRNNKPKFKIGDIVRIYKFKRIFEKGYSHRWTNELFIVYKYNDTVPHTYRIKTLKKVMDDMNI